MDFNQIYNEIISNKENHMNGYYNCIPFMGMERLEKFIPGIEQETYYLLTASSGVGKSKFARYLFIHNPYMYVKQNPDSGIKLTVKYFSLEESKKKVILSEISKYLHTRHGLNISIKQLQSKGRYNTIDANTIAKIQEAEQYVQEYLDVVDVIDHIRNPTGIYKYMRDFALEVGNYYHDDNTPFTEEEVLDVKFSRNDTYKKIAYYKMNHPKHYVIVLCDHISLLEQEDGLTLWQTMGRYSSNYCLRMRDKFGFIPVNVQQQASDKERIDTNFKGETIESKLEPSLDGLGDNKTTQRDANIIIGLFNPHRYGIAVHNGYNIKLFKDHYRDAAILKDRDGIANLNIPLFFNGATDFFKELPRPDDTENLQRVEQYLNEIKRR